MQLQCIDYAQKDHYFFIDILNWRKSTANCFIASLLRIQYKGLATDATKKMNNLIRNVSVVPNSTARILTKMPTATEEVKVTKPALMET